MSTVFPFHTFSSFCTRLVFLYRHFILLYKQQLTISLCCFLHNFFLTQKLLSPQYLELQSILCRFHFLIDTKCLYLGWNSLCLVSNFLVLLSISSSWSLDHRKNAAEYLTTDTAQVFIALKTLPLFNFVSNIFSLFCSTLSSPYPSFHWPSLYLLLAHLDTYSSLLLLVT